MGIGGSMLAVAVALALAVPMSLAAASPGEYDYYLVEFAQLPDEHVRGDIEAAYHVAFLGYHQNKTYMLMIPAERLAQISASPLISNVAEYTPAEKISPGLMGAAGAVMLRIDVHPGEDVEAVASLLASLGAAVTRVDSDMLYFIECRADASAVQEMAGLKPVCYIQPDDGTETAGPIDTAQPPPEVAGSTKNVMVTGFWNPTGQMIAHWSNDTYLNPGGWDGANWEGWGYNVYSYFPDWHGGLFNGTFEVDYQNVGGYPAVPGFYGDFWNITNIIHPAAIVGFGAGYGPWMLENNARNLGTSPMWIDDNWNLPYQPTPRPPDPTQAQNYVRHSTLPKQNISIDVSASGIPSVINNGAYGTMGEYLCEFTAYLEEWYQAAHNYTNDSYRCRAAGWVHTDSEPLDYTYAQYRNAANITVRDTIKYLIALAGTTAEMTGPVGSSNAKAVTLTYTWTGNPTSVNLYYTKNAGATWTLAGVDSTVDGSFAYTIAAGDGTYGWLASAVGGNSTEPSPPTPGTVPEAAPYVLDTVAPAAPTGLTVEHWGPTGATNNETRYMRDDNALGLVQTATGANYLTGSGGIVYTGFRAWVLHDDNTETELTSGTATAIVNRSGTGQGIQTSAWPCPQTSVLTTDSVRVRVYQSIGANPPTGLAAKFTTEQLGASSIDSATWTLSYYTRRAVTANDRFYWGNSLYNSNIAGFRWSVTYNPLLDNTLNWTASPSADLDHYDIYRDADGTGVAYSLIGTVPAGTNTYCDADRGQADGTRWWYRVRAVDAATNEETNTDGVQEPGGTPYAIDLAGKSAGWVFVSYPVTVSGHIELVLNDTSNGDGGTDWDAAKTWNNLEKKWLTYRKGGWANTFTDVSNAMGIWLHLTTNTGDCALSLPQTGEYPDSIAITLYTGWNCVGYPSATARLGSATLPGAADRVSVWQAAVPYITDSTPGAVTMSHGNGYWVHVTADCVWMVYP